MENWNDTERKDQNMGFFLKGMKALWVLFDDEQSRICNVLYWMIFITLVNVSIPWIYKIMFDDLQAWWKGAAVQSNFVMLVLVILIIRTLRMYLEKFAIEPRFLRSVIRLENIIPCRALEKLTVLSLGYHEKENTGKKIAKINKGCERFITIICQLKWGLIPHLLFLIVHLIFVIIIDWRLGILFMIPFIPAFLINVYIERRFGEIWEQWDQKKELSTGYFCQAIINIFSVKIFDQEKREQNRFSSIRNQMRDMDIDVSIRIQKYFFFIGVMLNVFSTLCILAWYMFATKGQSNLGTIIVIITVSNEANSHLWGLVQDYLEIIRHLVSVIRMDELLKEPVDIENADNPITPSTFEGHFLFKDITFSYPGKEQPVFNGFNLSLEPNTMTALVGKSGEGKTTIARLITRMYDIQSGDITLDGNDIKELDISWFRRKFAVVQQDVDIFDATIHENIVYAYPDATEHQIQQAITAAHLQDVVHDSNRFPDGLQTLVGERGVRLSGGERQRVGIARAIIALLNGAKVLILDEATSNLDSMAERAIQNMIATLRSSREISIIAIAHRLSTIKQSDLIYVINQGNIVESGNHSRLMAKNGLYKELVELQKLGEIRE